jgi:hypothetical protein
VEIDMSKSNMNVSRYEDAFLLTQDLADRIYTLFIRCMEIVPEEAPFSPNCKACADRFMRCVLAMLDQQEAIPFDQKREVAEFNLRQTLDDCVYAYDCNDVYFDLTLEVLYILMVVMQASGWKEMRDYCLEDVHEVVL